MSVSRARDGTWLPAAVSATVALAVLYSVTQCYICTSQLQRIEAPAVRTRLSTVRRARDPSWGRLRAARVERPLELSIVSPLEYDKDEGAYMLRVGVGRGLVACVVDSGSAHLTVKGSDCHWSNCYKSEREANRQVLHVVGGSVRKEADGRFCIARTCPCGRDKHGRWLSDCRDRSYTPSAKARALRAGGGLSETLAYGSQTNRVQHFEETIALMDTKGVMHDMTGDRRMVVYQIYKVDGDTSSNIIGLTTELRRRGRDDTFSHTFLDAARVKRWTIALDTKNPTMTLRSRVDDIPTHALSLPLVHIDQEPLLEGLALSNVIFYTCRLRAIGLSTPSNETVWWRSDAGTFPHFVVFDTGTTNSYADAILGSELRARLGWREDRNETLHLEFTNGVVMTWNFDEMIDPDGVPGVTSVGKTVTALHCESGRTYDNFKDIFGGSYFIMIGIRMMNNRVWMHDLENMMLHVWRV